MGLRAPNADSQTFPVEGSRLRVRYMGERFVVVEAGPRSWVNLEAYLDTGLFLDHRALRSMRRSRAIQDASRSRARRASIVRSRSGVQSDATEPTMNAGADSMRGLHRILIVGGGAGGLPLATRLGETLGNDGRAEITLVDRFATHLWKPLLHEVAAGRMDADAHGIDYLALAHWHGFRFRQGAVEKLDRRERWLELAAVQDEDGNEMLPSRRVGYDTLVFAVGSISNDFSLPGVAKHAISLDTAADAERFHRRLLAACVRADASSGQGKRATVEIVIIGAGATGVELAAELRQTTRAHAGYGLDQLVGRLIGGSLLIEGLIARWMYAMLYKLHQVSVHGYYRVVLDTLGRFLRRRLEPRVKLH